MKILGVKIDQINLPIILEKIKIWTVGQKQNFITTVNPEFVVAAQKNPEFKAVLNNADLAICDGAGLIWAGKYLQGEKLIRVTGVELTEKLLESNFGAKIFLLGGEEGIAAKVAAKYPDSIVGFASGGKINPENYLLSDNAEIVAKINASQANLLLVAFGQIKQEMWIKNNLVKIPNVKIAIGVGGTFDYLSGKIKRAPKWLRQIGLEWLFRLIQQPNRIGRIFDATIVFPFLVIKNKLKWK